MLSMYRTRLGGSDMLTYRAPRSMADAFPDAYRNAVECVYERPTLRQRLARYKFVWYTLAVVLVANLLYRYGGA